MIVMPRSLWRICPTLLPKLLAPSGWLGSANIGDHFCVMFEAIHGSWRRAARSDRQILPDCCWAAF